MEGFIKLARCLLDKPILQNPKLVQVWIWCLLKATHKEHEQMVGFRKITLEPGQFITGRFKGASELKMSPSTFRNCLEWLKENKSIDVKADSKFSLITIVNWQSYQVEKFKDGQQSNSKVTANGQQLDTNKNVKNVKNDKNKDIYIVPYDEIIAYLNQVCNTKFRLGDANKKHINARWDEGHLLQDFKTVIDKKATEWLGTEQAKYLRPETLFGTKFDSYLNQIISSKKIPRGFASLMEDGGDENYIDVE